MVGKINYVTFKEKPRGNVFCDFIRGRRGSPLTMEGEKYIQLIGGSSVSVNRLKERLLVFFSLDFSLGEGHRGEGKKQLFFFFSKKPKRART